MGVFLLKLFVKDYKNTENPAVREHYGILSGFTGICCNLLLFTIKLIAGLMTGAISFIADAFNNLSDAGSSVVTLIGFKLAGKPADTEHPFGHGRFEYLSGLFVAVAIIMVGFELLKSSVSKVLHPQELTVELLPILIMAASICVKLWMCAFNRNLGRRINSTVMEATAQDSLNDCIATSVVIAAMLVYRFFGLNIDGIAGVIVALFILWGGIGTMRDTLQPLLGSQPDPEFVKQIEKTVMSFPDIIGIHDLIVHDYGPGRRIISLHAEVPADIDIIRAHETIDEAENEIEKKFHCDVSIHMDPIVTNDPVMNRIKQEVKAVVKSIDPAMTIHDFRSTQGENHRNLIFDVVEPYTCKLTPDELTDIIRKKVQEIDPKFAVVIKIDRGYV